MSEIGWDSVPGSARQALEPRGFSAFQARTLVEQLGFMRPQDFEDIMDSDITGLQLKPLQERALLRQVQAAKQELGFGAAAGSSESLASSSGRPSTNLNASEEGNEQEEEQLCAIARLHRDARKAYEKLSDREKWDFIHAFNEIDTDRNGCITFDELVRWWCSRLPPTNDPRSLDMVKAYWFVLDANADGLLDFYEVLAMLTLLRCCSPMTCDGCHTLILRDTHVWLHPESIRKYVLKMGEKKRAKNADLDVSFCESCCRCGYARHPRGYPLERVRNEWERPSFMQWSLITGQEANDDNDDQENGGGGFGAWPGDGSGAGSSGKHSGRRRSRVEKFMEHMEVMASLVEVTGTVAECIMQ